MYIRYHKEKLQAILQDLSVLTNTGIKFVDVQGQTLCRSSRSDDFCSAYQKVENNLSKCNCADSVLIRRCRESGTCEHHICHAGLYDFIMPIHKDGIAAGYIILGRIRSPESPAQWTGVDPALAARYLRLPCFSDTQLSSLRSLLSSIFFSSAIELVYSETAQEIQAYIDSHIQDRLQISDLCERFFISKNSLYKCFHAHYHCTVNEYITNLRLERAKALLAQTDTPISGICEYVGITNYTYFCKLFKKHNEISPGTYRRLHRDTP